MKKAKRITIVSVLLLSVASCLIFTAGGSKKGGEKVPEKPFEGVTIHVAMVDEPREQKLKQWSPELEKKTGMKVVVDLLGWEELVTKTLTSSQAKTAEYDVMLLENLDIPFYTESGWLHDLTPWIERDADEVKPDDFYPFIRDDISTYKGKWVGMPMHNNSLCFFYRKDIFEEMGFSSPNTWDEAIKYAKAITQKYSPEMYGISFMGAADIQLGAEFTSIITAEGGFYYDDNYNSTTNSPAGLRTMKILKELTKWAPPGIFGYDLDGNYNAFAQGKAAMCVGWTTGTFYFEDPETSKVMGKWEVTSMPSGRALLGTMLLTISKYSDNKEAAWEWTKWATSPEMEQRLLGIMESARLSILEDPQIQKEYPNNYAFYVSLENNPALWPMVRGGFEIVDKAAVITSEVITGVKTPEEGCKAMDEVVEQVLINYGYK